MGERAEAGGKEPVLGRGTEYARGSPGGIPGPDRRRAGEPGLGPCPAASEANHVGLGGVLR